MTTPRDILAALCTRPEASWDLAESALLVAATEYRGLDPRDHLAVLDELGRRAAARISGGEPGARALALARYLHEEERFDGNRDEYEDPRNSYLNEVLDRRVGLPILLSLVYCEVGRRAGVPLAGVGLPGHFIVEVDSPGGMLLDPFNGGRVVSVEECAKRLEEMYRGALTFDPAMLRAATPREILVRIIRNLKSVYAGAKDHERAWRMTDLILCVDPGAADEVRDRGLLSLELKRWGAAAADLTRYLEMRPGAGDRDAIVQGLRAARMAIAAAN